MDSTDFRYNQSIEFCLLVNSTTGFAAGPGATLIKTTNGGTTWTTITLPSYYDFSQINFMNANTGFIAGYDNNAGLGLILKTTNGGTTWTSENTGNSNGIRSVSFADTNTVYAVGGNGTVLKSTNGGTSWASQTSGTINNLFSVNFTDANTGYAVGLNGTIIKYQNISPPAVSSVPNLSSSDLGYTAYPIIYNSNLYFQYCNSSNKYQVAKYDGNSITLISNISSSDSGMIGQPVFYNNNLYFAYQNNSGKRYLAMYNGTTLSLISNTSSSDYGISGTPFVYNNNLYYPYQNATGNNQLAKYNGSNVTLISNQNNTDIGCNWSPIIYNNKLFFGYNKSKKYVGYLANYDGTNLNLINDPTAILDSNVYGFVANLIVYNQALYFRYYQHNWGNKPALNEMLAKYDGSSISLLAEADFSFYSPIIFDSSIMIGHGERGGYNALVYEINCLVKFINNNNNNNNNLSFVGGTCFDDGNSTGAGYNGNAIIFNNNLYFIMSRIFNSSYVVKYNDSVITNMQNPDSSTNGGFFGIPIIYNNKMYYSYINASGTNILTKFDGAPFKMIPNTNGVSGNFIVYSNALYYQYLNVSNKYQLGKYVDLITPDTLYAFNVSGGGTNISCNLISDSITLSGSQTNTTYYLYRNNVLNDSLSGTANNISWYNKTVGTYKVIAKNAWSTLTMNDSVIITTNNNVPSPASSITGTTTVCI